MPPVVKTGTMDIFKTDELFREGKVACDHRVDRLRREQRINPKTSKVADKVAFAQHPGMKGADGKIDRWANIGGQPFVLTTWNSDEVDPGERSTSCKWWLSDPRCRPSSPRGGQSGRKSVYEKPDYVDASGPGTGPGRRASTGRRTSGTCRTSSSSWSSRRRSTSRRSPASRTRRRRWTTSRPSSRTC